MQDAFVYAHSHGLTTMSTCQKARMKDSLTRAEAAKMVSNYAMNILDKSPDANVICSFSDMTNADAESQSYAKTACQLGIMGLKGDGSVAPTFNPNGLIDKAQLATILSRLLYGNFHNSNTCWYCEHVETLQADGVITVTTDLFAPIPRGWAMLMFMRSE